MFRKIVWFLLVVFLFSGDLLAQQKELVVWHSYRAKEKRALELVVARFNRVSESAKVKLLAIPYDAYADKISAAIPRGNGPDLFIFAHDRVGDWAKSKLIEPITFWVDNSIVSRFFPQTVQGLVYKNALYGLPLAFKSLALFYNKKLIQNPPTTTQELLKVAKKLTNISKGQYGIVYEAGNFYNHALWLHGFGGQVFKGDLLTIDSKESIQSFQFLQNLSQKHKLLPAEPTSHLVSSLFNENKAAMVINGPWFRGEINESIDYGVALLPIISKTKKRAAPFLTSEAIFLNHYGKNKKLAFGFMNFVTSIKSAMTRMTVGKQTVANKNAFNNPKAKQDAVLMMFKEQLQYSVLMPNTPEMRLVWSPLLTALGEVLRGQKTPKEALETAQKSILSFIQSKKGK